MRQAYLKIHMLILVDTLIFSFDMIIVPAIIMERSFPYYFINSGITSITRWICIYACRAIVEFNSCKRVGIVSHYLIARATRAVLIFIESNAYSGKLKESSTTLFSVMVPLVYRFMYYRMVTIKRFRVG